MSDAPGIFIAVASYMEPHLVGTVADALACADRPDRLSFGIAEQAVVSRRPELLALSDRIAIVHSHPVDSDGPAWARGIAMDLRDTEEYCCQIDAHTRFAQGWDRILVESWHDAAARAGHRRVLLSALPPAWTTDAYGRPVLADVPPGAIRVDLSVREIDPLYGTLPVLAATVTGSADHLRGHFPCNSFLFAPAAFADALPVDPDLYFNTDDLALAVRAFTFGWEVWHPARVPLFHLYRSGRGGEAFLHWAPPFAAQRRTSPLERDSHARDRLLQLLSGRLRGAYGAGDVRPLDDFFEETRLVLVR